MERQQIDPTTVAVSVEADLVAHDPAMRLEPIRPEGGKRRMVRIQEPIHLVALPTDIPGERQLDRADDRASGANAQPGDVPALQQAARRCTHACGGCKVDQPSPGTVALGSHGLTEAPIVNRAMMTAPGYRAVIGQLAASPWRAVANQRCQRS